MLSQNKHTKVKKKIFFLQMKGGNLKKDWKTTKDTSE